MYSAFLKEQAANDGVKIKVNMFSDLLCGDFSARIPLDSSI